MKTLIRLIRLIQINFTLARNGFDQLILSLHLFRPLRFLTYLNPWNWGKNRYLTHGERIRYMLEQLGPIFVKFGQSLSTRRDLIPPDIADELALLQDRVPPFSGEIARAIIEKALGSPINEIFLAFDPVPLASASIAQVHTAKLFTGQQVVIKVLRPNVEKLIRRDVDLLYVLAGLAVRYWADGRRLKPREVVAEFEKHLIDELDLIREAANASQLRRNFHHSNLLYIPEIYWDYTRKNILVQERIYGIPISDIDKLKQHHIDLKALAERGVEIFFTQVFRDCFFHADMHPGNIFVSPANPKNPQYLGVDFGIVGTLSSFDQRYLAENMLAFFNRDYRRVAELHVESGWVPANTRIEDFESAIRTVCEPIFQRPLKEISFGQLLLNLFQTARRFHMEIQPQLVLLQKTLFNIEGLGRVLYPDLDLWQTAKPYLERWLKEQVGPRAFIRKVRKYAPYWAEKMPEIPDLIYQTLTEIHQQKRYLLQSQDHKDQQQDQRHLRRISWQIGIGSALIIWAFMNEFAQFWEPLIWFHQTVSNSLLGVAGLLFLLLSRLGKH